MSNFFKDYIDNTEQVGVINKSFEGLFDVLQSQLQEISRNNNISKVLTYRRIQFQRIDITEAVYSLTDLLNDASIMSVIGVESNSSYNQKLDLWNAMNPMEKARLLDIANYSIMLTSFSHLLDEDEFMARKFNVIDFELTDFSNNKYIRNVDYAFFDNKLFLLKQFSADDAYRQKYLILKDIVIDTNTTEDTLGEHLNIPYNFEFTKTDYTETLKGFIEAAAGGPTLSNLSKSINRYKALDGIRVSDKKSATVITEKFWGKDGYVGTLTDFDFIVTMPVSLVYKPEKLEYIRKFFTQIKPSYADFIFTPELSLKDELPLKFVNDKLRIEGEREPFEDKLNAAELPSALNLHSTKDFMEKDDYSYQKPTHFVNDFYDVKKKDLSIKAVSTELKNLINYEEKYTYKLGLSANDKVHVRRWVNDGYYLDEDYFDLVYLTDPFKALNRHFTFDSFNDFKDSQSAIPTFSPTDVIKVSENKCFRLNLELFEGILITGNDKKNNSILKADIGMNLDTIIAKSKINQDITAKKFEVINATDVTKADLSTNKKEYIRYNQIQKKIINFDFKERKVYFPFNEKHDSFNFDLDRFFDPMVMTSSAKPMPIISPVSKLLNYRDSISIDKMFGRFSDSINYFEKHSTIVSIKLYDSFKNYNANIENLYNADSGDVLDSIILKEAFKPLIKKDDLLDSIKSLEGLSFLNGNILCDKIMPVNDVENFSFTDMEDNIPKALRANILKCDSIFSADYSGEFSLNLDLAPDGYIENSASEMVELKLIPKIKGE